MMILSVDLLMWKVNGDRTIMLVQGEAKFKGSALFYCATALMFG
jgi:hypothetical protein